MASLTHLILYILSQMFVANRWPPVLTADQGHFGLCFCPWAIRAHSWSSHQVTI